MIYLYAIADAGTPAPATLGIDERPVDALSVAGVTALVSDGPAVDARGSSLRAHDRVVRVAMDHGAVLPVRFGTVAADAGALDALLRGRSRALRSTLDRVRGRVEVGVRAVWRDAPRPARDGRDFLAAKLERRRAAERLHAPLAKLADDVVCRIAPDASTAFSAAYLVQPARAATLAARTDLLARTEPAVRVVCSGPWPPYSFSEAHR